MDREAWHAAVHGLAKSWTQLSDWTELTLWNVLLNEFVSQNAGLQQICYMRETHSLIPYLTSSKVCRLYPTASDGYWLLGIDSGLLFSNGEKSIDFPLPSSVSVICDCDEFNSDDHYIFYHGQESLRRNGVVLKVNKRVWNGVLGYNLKNDRMISVHFKGKPFSIKIIQLYAPTTNAREEQGLLELTHTHKKSSFHHRGCCSVAQ